MNIFKKIFRFFDKLEDRVRGFLSHFPIVYALIGGTMIVLFWRGVWHTGDMLMAQGGFLGILFYEPITVAWTIAILLMTGLFVSFFIGDRIFLSGLLHEKKVFDKTVQEVVEEESEIIDVIKHVKVIEKELALLTAKVNKMQSKLTPAQKTDLTADLYSEPKL